LQDLHAALTRLGVPATTQNQIVEQHRNERLKIETFALATRFVTNPPDSF
jgi:hypothetical protein